MRAGMASAALLVLALGAASAMAGGMVITPRTGAFPKCGPGVEVRQREEAPAYQLTGQPSAQPAADRTGSSVHQFKVDSTHQ